MDSYASSAFFAAAMRSRSVAENEGGEVMVRGALGEAAGGSSTVLLLVGSLSWMKS